ncbi:EpsG family protein [Psychrobacter urativorans]|uniref:EpsG family protein n=1 Tax=Psychrobacter urativorans TaxID=45610 RepID=UPI001D120A0A|nr:EpsG family protein [Psychrobacter urativorans]
MFWITLEQKALGRKAFWLPLIVLALFAGIRSNLVGTDSETYTRYFVNQLSVNNLQLREGFELGYRLLEYNLLELTHNYFWLFFISGLIVVYCYLKVIKKYSMNYSFSIFLFITLGTYTFFFNGLRQGLSMAIFALATPYLLEKRIIPYLLICGLASLFHTSALFMIPFYFLVNINIKLIYKLSIAFVTSILGSRLLISYIAASNSKYESYTEVVEKGGGYLTLGFFALLVVFIYFIIHIYKIREARFIKLFTFYAVGVLFLIPIAMLGASPSGPQRLLTYFTWTLVLLLPIVFKRINNIYVSVVFVVIAITYFVLSTSRLSGLTPYIINPIFEIF